MVKQTLAYLEVFVEGKGVLAWREAVRIKGEARNNEVGWYNVSHGQCAA